MRNEMIVIGQELGSVEHSPATYSWTSRIVCRGRTAENIEEETKQVVGKMVLLDKFHLYYSRNVTYNGGI